MISCLSDRRSNHHLQNLKHLGLLLEWDWVRLAPSIMQAILRKPVQRIAANANVTQRPRHAQVADHRVENVTQVQPLHLDRVSSQHIQQDGIANKKVAHTRLAFAISIVLCIELADSRQEDTARFTVTDAKGTKLREISNARNTTINAMKAK